MGMTGSERKQWLSQISRIHAEQKEIRNNELSAELDMLMESKNTEN